MTAPTDPRREALDTVLAVLDQIPGRNGDWMNVKYAAAIVDRIEDALAVARRDAATTALREFQSLSTNWRKLSSAMPVTPTLHISWFIAELDNAWRRASMLASPEPSSDEAS